MAKCFIVFLVLVATYVAEGKIKECIMLNRVNIQIMPQENTPARMYEHIHIYTCAHIYTGFSCTTGVLTAKTTIAAGIDNSTSSTRPVNASGLLLLE